MASTLFQLRTRELIYLNDLQNTINASGSRYQTPYLNQITNDVVKYYTRLLNSNYQGYLSSSITLDIIGGIKVYALGPSFRSPIYEVRRTINQVDYNLDPFHPYEVALDTTPVPNSSWLPRYYLEGNNIVFLGIPQSDEFQAVTIKFQAKTVDLVSDSDQIDDQLYDAEDCIVLRSVLRALRAKDVSGALKNTIGFDNELKDAENTFYCQVGNRYIRHDHPIPTDSGDDFFI